MRTIASWTRNVLIGVATGALLAATPRAQSTDVAFALARIGERVAEYYKRVQNIVCTEKSTVQPISFGFSPEGFPRTTESELRIEADADGDGDTPKAANVLRRILRVNGRAPREKDKKDRAACTDPNPLSPEPLAFLLPANQHEYAFSRVTAGKGRDANLLIVEFTIPGSKKPGKLMEDPGGHEDCFSWDVEPTINGRVWVDASTFDVVRLEERLNAPVTVSVSNQLQSKYGLPNWIVIERSDKTIRLKTQQFKEPDETLLLPLSIETLTVVRNALQSNRRAQEFSDYRRFVTGARLLKEPGAK